MDHVDSSHSVESKGPGTVAALFALKFFTSFLRYELWGLPVVAVVTLK